MSFLVFVVGRHEINFFARNAIALLGPATEIDQPAPLGAKRSMGIVLPLGFFPTGGTFYFAAHDSTLCVYRVGSEKFINTQSSCQKPLVGRIVDESLQIRAVLFYSIWPWVIPEDFPLLLE